MSMKKAYDTSSRIFEQIESRKKSGIIQYIQKLKAKDIIVVKGEYDHIDLLLKQIHIPFTRITPSKIPAIN